MFNNSEGPFGLGGSGGGVSPISGAVTSVFGRDGVVVATAGDYGTTKITNQSSVAGATTTIALNNLLATDNALIAISGNQELRITSNTNSIASLVSITGGLQSQITTLSINNAGITGGISQLDNAFVNIGGDRMTGSLSTPVLNMQDNNLFTTSISGDIFYHIDPDDYSGLYHNAGGYIKQLDCGPNTIGPIQKISISGNGDGTISVPASKVNLFSNSDWSGNYRHYHLLANPSLALTNGSINYLVADFNSGSPIYAITTNSATINNSSIALLATMSLSGSELHWIPVDWGLATATKLNNRQINIQRFERSSGLTLGENTGRIITISSGVAWYGASSFALSITDSTSGNVGADFWYHVGGSWTKTTVNTYNNSQYDNGTNLVTLSGPGTQYAVNWVYRYLDGSGLPKIAYVLGTGNYSQSQALASTVPTIPTLLDRMAILVGRIIVAQDAVTSYQIDSAFTRTFAGSTVTSHNNLDDLQGGTTSEYYHFTSADYADRIGRMEVATISAGLQVQVSAKKTDSMSTAKLLGRSTAGTGVIEEITLGTGLAYTGTTLNVTVSGGTGGGHTIQDEGSSLTQRSKLNFVGSGVTVTDDAGNDATVVSISISGGSGASTFLELTDTPSSYSGEGGKGVRVNSGATGLEFYAISGGSSTASPSPIRFTIGGDSGAAIVANAVPTIYYHCPTAATMVSWTALGDISGSISVDVWANTYANFPPLSGDKISSTYPITISGGTKQQGTMANWGTQAISADSVLAFKVTQAATITMASFDLKVS